MPDVLNKVISFISGGDDGGDDKQLLLRQIAKEVQQNKYTQFYRARTEEAAPAFAQYLYNVYKAIYPVQSFFKKNPSIMERLKSVTLESYLEKSVIDVIKRLSPEAVAERRRTAGANLPAELEKDLEHVNAGFDDQRVVAADKCYNLLMYFHRFITYDFVNLLRKFDPDFQDGFTIPPKFGPVRADTMMGDAANFLALVPPFDPQDDWRTVLEILKYCNGGGTLLAYETWMGLLNSLKDVKQSKILEAIIRLASQNPIWESKATAPTWGQLSSTWLAEKTSQVRQVITGIADNQRNNQIAVLEREVFNASEVTRLSYYTKEKGRILTQKEVDTYIYAPALNHLAAFVQDFFINKEMAELSDILLVRGQWTQNAASNAMSEAYHSILEIGSAIEELDETLSTDGSNGPRLRGALLRVDRDQSQARYLNSMVGSLNDEALDIINRIIPAFIVVGKSLKMLLDDCQRKSYELIMNWKELTQISKAPMAQRLTDDYKKINYFVQLMILETQQEESEE